MRSILITGVVGFLAAIQADAGELAKKDKAQLQGTWKVTRAASKGEVVPEGDIKDLYLIIEEDRIQVREGGKTQERFTFRLRPEKDPKEVDFTFTDGPKKGRTDRAIYDITADRLKFCIQEDPQAARPKDFTSAVGTQRFLVILERVKK